MPSKGREPQTASPLIARRPGRLMVNRPKVLSQGKGAQQEGQGIRSCPLTLRLLRMYLEGRAGGPLASSPKRLFETISCYLLGFRLGQGQPGFDQGLVFPLGFGQISRPHGLEKIAFQFGHVQALIVIHGLL